MKTPEFEFSSSTLTLVWPPAFMHSHVSHWLPPSHMLSKSLKSRRLLLSTFALQLDLMYSHRHSCALTEFELIVNFPLLLLPSGQRPAVLYSYLFSCTLTEFELSSSIVCHPNFILVYSHRPSVHSQRV